MEADIVVDVIVSDIPVQDPAGDRIRPQLLTLIDGRKPRLVAMRGTTGDVSGQDLVMALVDAANTDLSALPSRQAPALVDRLTLSIPAALAAIDTHVADCLDWAGIGVVVRPRAASALGEAASGLLGHTLAGYSLRPRLAGRPPQARVAGHGHLAAMPVEEAVSYLFRVAQDGLAPAASPLLSLGGKRLETLVSDLESSASLQRTAVE